MSLSEFMSSFANFIADTFLDILNSLVLELTKLAFAHDVSHIGRELVYTSDGKLLKVSFSGVKEQIDQFNAPFLYVPRFSPSGKWVAYLAFPFEDSPSSREMQGVHLYNLNTRQRRQIYRGYASNLLFTSDDRWLLLQREDGVYLLSANGEMLRTWAKRVASFNTSPRGEVCVEIDEEPFYVIADWRWLVSQDGKAMALSRANRNPQDPLARIAKETEGRVAWSPKGRRIAYIRRSDNNISEVYVSENGGLTSKLLIRQVGSVICSVLWSALGDRVVFLMLTPEGGGYEGSIWWMDINAVEARRFVP
jgi:Tol biopolymer transport system component